MDNWIEEAEKRQKLKENIQTEEEKKHQENRSSNLKKLHPFIDEFVRLTSRVSKLSPEEREPCIEIGFTHLKGDDKFEFYGSAYIIRPNGTIPLPGAKKEVLCWRRIHFRPANKLGMFKLNVYEKYNDEKKGSEADKRKHIIKINKINEALIMEMLNWIAFRTTTNQFYTKLPVNRKSRSGGDKRCFIATAVYGTPDCKEIDTLRNFRDNRLLTNTTGRIFVKVYYKASPPFARMISDRPLLKKIVRLAIIEPLLKISGSSVQSFR